MRIVIVLAISLLFITNPCSQAADWPELSGPYFGQKPPGMIPEMFAQFIADSNDHKHSAPAFSGDGTEMFFSVFLGNDFPERIMVTRLVDGIWSKPTEAAFSGTFHEGGPKFAPDGNRLYFYSRRPTSGGTEPSETPNIWHVDRTDDGWSDPILLTLFSDFEYGATIGFVGTDESVYATIETKNPRDFDLWVARKERDTFAKPVKIGSPISKPGSYEFGGILIDDGQTLIFSAAFRYHTGGVDLFISTKNEDSTWSEPRRMGDMINRGNGRFAGLSPDGKYFYFTSYRSGPEEIYWVDASIIDYLKTEDLNLIDAVMQTLLDSGKDAALAQYHQFEKRHNRYYTFDELLFGTVADYLMDKNSIDAANLAFEINEELFGKTKTLVQQLRIAVQNNDDSEQSRLLGELVTLSRQPGNMLENDINRLGYRLMGLDLVEPAIRAFRTNTMLFPNSGNVFDSYAEALLMNADTTASIENYKNSLRLDPNNENARKILTDLGVTIE